MATITGDFFGDSELAGLGVEGLVSLEGGGSLGAGGGAAQQMLQEWTLPSEAFEQKAKPLHLLMNRMLSEMIAETLTPTVPISSNRMDILNKEV